MASAVPSWAAQRENFELFQDVSQQVLRYPQYTIFDSLHAEVQDGVVTLTGKVTMPYKARDLEHRVAQVDGVRQVRNEITTLPVSSFDNDLRFRIARAIYGNSHFWRYGAMVNPPIHIIVDGGRVTLEGVVNSDMDRMLARSIASSFNAFSVTSDLKTDAEVEQELERL
jgi:hyperosmotically inducible protein